MKSVPRIAITSGEPAGIGPDLCLSLQQHSFPAELVLISDPDLANSRSTKSSSGIRHYQAQHTARAGQIVLDPINAATPVQCGQLNQSNARYVLNTLDRAIDGCLNNEFQALVTAPVHKGIINDAGIAFTGHTEYLAKKTATEQVVMMLATPGLRVALATTHLPLNEVAQAITRTRLSATLQCLNSALKKDFGITNPHILVAGLNPHAGEGGHLGREEIDVIEPVIRSLNDQGMHLTGPLPADTLFTPPLLEKADAVLAMYHDQGLPVLKHLGFGQAVNITLGLPIIRTSVDHGTALDLAGTQQADSGSLNAAIQAAIELVENRPQ